MGSSNEGARCTRLALEIRGYDHSQGGIMLHDISLEVYDAKLFRTKTQNQSKIRTSSWKDSASTNTGHDTIS